MNILTFVLLALQQVQPTSNLPLGSHGTMKLSVVPANALNPPEQPPYWLCTRGLHLTRAADGMSATYAVDTDPTLVGTTVYMGVVTAPHAGMLAGSEADFTFTITAP